MSLNSLQDDMSRRAASMAAMAKRANRPDQIEAIQKSLVAGVQNGTIKPYVGIPLIQELTNKLSEVKAKMAQSVAGAGMQQPQQGGAPIAQQIMAQASQADQSRGVETLTSNLPESYAGGGIIAFEDGGKVERYQNTGFTGMGNISTPYSATNPNVAMNEFLKRLNLSPAQFANASPEAQKNILDMFRSASEAPKPMATPTVTPTASAAPTAPATSGPYRAGQAVGQAVRGGTSGAGNFLSRGLIGTIGGPATGGLAALLTPSPLGDDQAVLAALRGEGYQGQPYDVLGARKILEAAGMDPNKAPIKPVTPAAQAQPSDPSSAPPAPPAPPAAPANVGFKMPTLQTYTPTTATLPERTAPVLTNLDALTKKLPEDAKRDAKTAVDLTQKTLEDMDRPGFEAREERLGKREAGLERENAISRALTGIKTGLRVAGSKERTLAGALGNEGSQGIEDLIRGEAANRAAKDKLEDYRDNLEQQKVASKKGNYQAAQAAGERAADNLYKYTNLNLNAASAGNSQALQRQQIEQTGDIGKAGVLNQGEQLKLSAADLANRNALGIAQLQATTSSTNAQLQLGRERLGILKDQIAAGNERARATLVQAETKAAAAWQTSPQFQQVQAQAKKMAPIEAQRFMQNSWLQYKENMLPSLMGGGGANIPSFNDMYKATE
jgi:hypothetical protein